MQFSSDSVELPTSSSFTGEWSFGEDPDDDVVDENEDEVEAKDEDGWEDLFDALVVELPS